VQMKYETCRIGQLSRCTLTGCEWKKTFGGYCRLRPTQVEIDFRNSKHSIVADKTKHKPKGRFVKEELKYTEIKKFKGDFNEIKTQEQDSFIKKIKVKL